jgi:hypothetical protein
MMVAGNKLDASGDVVDISNSSCCQIFKVDGAVYIYIILISDCWIRNDDGSEF